MIGDFASDRFILLDWPVGTTALTWYVRPGGDDDNDGTTALTAFATLGRALREVPLYASNRPTIIDITGMTISANELLQLGGGALGSTINTFNTPVPPLFANRRQVQIIATPTVAKALTVTSQTADGITNLTALTVSTALAANELDDTILVDASGNYGAVHAYTTGAGPNTVYVASTATFDAATTAYVPGASLAYGDAAQGLDGAIYLTALADWYFEWVSFASVDDAKPCAMTVWAHQPVTFFGCVLNGLQVEAAPAAVSLFGSVIRNGSLVLNGGVQAQRCNLRSLGTVTCRDGRVAGNASFDQVGFTACAALGGGSSTSRFNCEVTQCQFDAATTYAIRCLAGNWNIANTRIDDSGASAVYVKGAHVEMSAVAGTGNADWGVEAAWDCSVDTDSLTSVTGTFGGDVSLGSAGSIAWVSFPPTLPLTDGEQLLRVFHQGGI